MPPKSISKRKKSKILPEKEYPLLTLEEMKIKESNYNKRLKELTKCLNFIDDALHEISSLNDQQLLQDKWLQFVSCNPLPKPYIPADIRLFYNKMKYFEKENVEKTINWLLTVNERSLLSQDIYRQDLSRRQLNKELKENIGLEYNDYVKDSLEILHRIENFLCNVVEVAKCPLDILQDIKGRKLAIQKEILDLMDRYTYRIISSEKSQMKSIDAISAEYCFKAEDFRIHIWCLKNVALRIKHLSEPCLLANFHSLNLLLHIPSNMLQENLVIRAVHMEFDHLSENAKSFKHEISFSSEHLNSGITDLHECLVNEWIMQIEIQAKIRDEMIQKHLVYEGEMQQYEAEMESKKGRKRDDKKTKITKKLVKPLKEPLDLGNDLFPNTYEDFLMEEQTQYESFIHKVYNPELLELTSDEINLKKYFILGGIYQLNYVEKPLHNDFNSFNMTWHKNHGRLKVDTIVEMPFSKDSKSFLNDFTFNIQNEPTKRPTKLQSIFDAQNLETARNAECPCFILSIELPEYLCYWDHPVACHFETFNGEIEKKEKEVVQLTTLGDRDKKKDVRQLKVDGKIYIPEIKVEKSQESLIFTDFSALNQSEKMEGNDFSLDSKRLTASQTNTQVAIIDSSTDYLTKDRLIVNDFPLTYTLTKLQIRHMERHIIPRIISSYKFPKEIRLEELELYNKKPKGKGGKIIRQKNVQPNSKITDRQFTFNAMQNTAERIFAIYPKVKPLQIITYLKDINLPDEQHEPQTFAQLLQIVSNIKKKYRLRMYQTLNLKPFETHIQTHNKRIKQMQRRKELLAAAAALKGTSITSTTGTSRKGSKRISSKIIASLASRRSDKEGVDREVLDEVHNGKIIDATSQNDNNTLIDGEKEGKRKEEDIETVTVSHWTTKYILKSEFDRAKRKMVIYTNRLGNFGFAFKRYEHFPFKYWSMEPSPTNPNNEIVFTLDTQYVRCVLYITPEGIRGHVTESSKTYIRNPKMYLIIEKPLNDYKEFKKLFKAKHLNIFAENDASFYIENGYFSEKHLSNEMHTYCCMSIHCTQMRFNFSQWNRLAQRRDIILHFKHHQDLDENLVQVRLTPGEAYFVEIQELCTEDLNIIKLDYNLTWRNIESYSDLHHLIVSMYPAATDLRCRNPKLICCIRDLLSEIRPLSFS